MTLWILVKIALLPFASEQDTIHQLYHLRMNKYKFNILATFTIRSSKNRLYQMDCKRLKNENIVFATRE